MWGTPPPKGSSFMENATLFARGRRLATSPNEQQFVRGGRWWPVAKNI
jgi:hypothetical protein